MLTPCLSKSSPLDAVQTTLLKSCADIFVTNIVCLANMSFAEGHFPARYRQTQLAAKSGPDSSLPLKFRPFSNLNTVSKILERLALIQLRPHLLNSSNFNEYQSGFRTGHSTETALLEVLDGVYTSADDISIVSSSGSIYLRHLTSFNMIHFDFAMSSESCQPCCPG